MSFAMTLKVGLLEHYKRPVSAAQVARDFSFFTGGVTPVSRETVRKWINGISTPDVHRLRLLVLWLRLDLHAQ